MDKCEVPLQILVAISKSWMIPFLFLSLSVSHTYTFFISWLFIENLRKDIKALGEEEPEVEHTYLGT